ncbi:sigma-70 family RNA polymerase sigma factor [Amycolatopsis acidiphila]|nr:sigma-70 family RNA polymerase sigma factor [Amycolatopsis acidiphila]
MISCPAAISAASSASEPVPDADSWALLDSARRGDLEAVAVLYRMHAGAVWRYIRPRVSSQDLADDFTSEVFVRMMRSMGSVRYQKGKFLGWLITIGRNIVFDYTKSRYHRSIIPMSILPDIAGSEPSTEEIVLRRRLCEMVWSGLSRLAPDQRACLQMRFFEGRSVAEAAAALGRSEGALRQLQLRAMRNLANLLEPEAISA